MATTKKCVKFYAEADIEAFLENIPAQTKSTWLNNAVRAAIEKEQGASELRSLKKFLTSKKNAPPLYLALADLLDDFEQVS
jgi:hypothetical protein